MGKIIKFKKDDSVKMELELYNERSQMHLINYFNLHNKIRNQKTKTNRRKKK